MSNPDVARNALNRYGPFYFADRHGDGYTIAELTPDRINTDNMLERLSKVNRWAGETRDPCSVARHSAVMYYEARRRGIASHRELRSILLHDAHEAWLVDLPKWVKALPELAPYVGLCNRLQMVINSKYDCDPSAYPSVAELDVWAASVEFGELIYPGIDRVTYQPSSWWHDFLAIRTAFRECEA